MTMHKKAVRVLSVSFGDEGEIEVSWTDENEHSNLGATVFSQVITPEGQQASEEMAYWTTELRQTVDEFLGNWRNFLRDQAR